MSGAHTLHTCANDAMVLAGSCGCEIGSVKKGVEYDHGANKGLEREGDKGVDWHIHMHGVKLQGEIPLGAVTPFFLDLPMASCNVNTETRPFSGDRTRPAFHGDFLHASLLVLMLYKGTFKDSGQKGCWGPRTSMQDMLVNVDSKRA
eukprot:scaffold148224_cov21-Tisochrysis_lutea.AAC.1